jgi:hypothetical protein
MKEIVSTMAETDTVAVEEEEEEQSDDDDDNSSPNSERKKCIDEIRVIAQSTENFISFSKSIPIEGEDDSPQPQPDYTPPLNMKPGFKRKTKNIAARFIDSFRFLHYSLSKLADLLPEDKFHLTRRRFADIDQFRMAKQKNFYPYEYMSDGSKFDEEALPSREAFYSSLTGEGISQEDYAFAQKAFDIFRCKNLGDYHDVYLTIDVLLLADVFENFREKCMSAFGLDPCWMYSLPGFTILAALKSTKVEIELLTDYDMVLFFERSIRGGFCFASKRYGEANHVDLPTYDPSKPNKHLWYIDANNLYGKEKILFIPSRRI